MQTMKRLLIVESPTKARTIRRFLPKDSYDIEASMGHVRDLPANASQIPAEYKDKPWARLGISIDEAFKPLYVVPSDKKKVVRKLKDALRNADELLIATDEDREGESIGWHLLEVLRPKVPARRMVFHEITKEAIQAALEDLRPIDHDLVDAQEARRVLDRLVGYKISPVLWKKVAPKLSAGRVQSVAVRLLVMRERERIAFVPASYWGLAATLEHDGRPFEATMTHLGARRLAVGRDFDDETGIIKKTRKRSEELLLLREQEARSLAAILPNSAWRVSKVEVRSAKRSPAPPFITSTLQQEASRKLRMRAQETMRTAQRLYERGLITYMRTDSVHLSAEAIAASRRMVEQRYGKDYVSAAPRQFKSKVRNAQEAHEAIRPAGTQMRPVREVSLTGKEAALYDLIWKRTVATQMAEARLRFVTAIIEVDTEGEEKAVFKATGRTVVFPGFFRAYVEGSDDPEAALDNRDQPLPDLMEGQFVACNDVSAGGHETKAPARYTEATLIKRLEKEGIGRPSTYASILSTIQNRGSAQQNGNAIAPTFTAFATNRLLEDQFGTLVDLGFTAGMEQDLDDIAAGKQEKTSFLQNLYEGDKGLEHRAQLAVAAVDGKEVSTITFPKWGDYVIRVGRYGPYAEGETDGESSKASLPPELLPGDVTKEKLIELLRQGKQPDEVLGIHPEHDLPMLLRRGPYGHYVQLGDDEQQGKPRRVSLPKGLAPTGVTESIAVELLRLPRMLGAHPVTGNSILANIGRYGPYVQHGSTFASLKSNDDVLTIELERALELVAEKEARSKPLRVLGQHPETGDPVEAWLGRYGPYVKHRKVNATLKKDQTLETVTLKEALGLLEERAAKKKTGSRRRRTKKR